MRATSALSPLGNARVAGLLVLLSLGCFAMVCFRPIVSGDRLFLFMLWNLFLAWLPYAASVAATIIAGGGNGNGGSGGRGRKAPGVAATVLVLGLGALWLLFLPNSTYLTTDFIHLVAGRHRYVDRGEFGYLVWFDIVLFFLFAWCGVFLAYLSTYQFQRLVAIRFGRPAGWAFVGAVSLLTGYGVFLGRIVRLNSWDAWVRPMELIGEVLGNLHWRGASFSLLFGVFMAVTYLFLYHLQEGDR
ncbi:DUF1361 domain-containing protein [Paenibacillus antri]|nr:DUF1361 domain-containing protein [Paenibacillus antri]